MSTVVIWKVKRANLKQLKENLFVLISFCTWDLPFLVSPHNPNPEDRKETLRSLIAIFLKMKMQKTMEIKQPDPERCQKVVSS